MIVVSDTSPILALAAIGLVGVLLQAKRSGYLSTVKPLLDDLFSKAGFRISVQLRRRVLDLAGEDET